MNGLSALEVLSEISLGIWIYLLIFRGQFWRVDLAPENRGFDQNHQSYPAPAPLQGGLAGFPSVCVVIPARNEAAVLPHSLRSLLSQTYAGEMSVIVVDDQSNDATASLARETAFNMGRSDQVDICTGTALPAGWSGKLWAMDQGVRQAKARQQPPKYFLFTDADIAHDPGNLAQLVARAETHQLSLVSLMVRLRCASFWEKLLIPAFVFFFQKLYPFRWVNQALNRTAAAAGGCILIRSDALERIGGLVAIHRALIDDCTLAKAVKSDDFNVFGEGRVWLGLSTSTHSLRSYVDLESIWTMVARTAFSQLDHSPLYLLGTLMGMGLIYCIPPFGFLIGLLLSKPALAGFGLVGWALMTLSFIPMLRFYRLSPFRAIALPAIAFLFTLMTLDSAWRYWLGRGGAWKGRTYAAS